MRSSLSPMKTDFEVFEGVSQNKDLENILVESGFFPNEKVLARDPKGNLICHYIKAKDRLGHSVYIELDCDYRDGMGFISISEEDPIYDLSKEGNNIPYSLKLGAFESNSNLSGVGFECEGSICFVVKKKSLNPVEINFLKNGKSSSNTNISPFPVVKMTEILANSSLVEKNVQDSHRRLRNIAFTSCLRDVAQMKENILKLEQEIERFERISSKASKELNETILQLENVYKHKEKKGVRTQKDGENLKTIRFNLQKRNDLQLDYISLCHSMKERSEKIRMIKDEISSLNNFSENLFKNLNSVFME